MTNSIILIGRRMSWLFDLEKSPLKEFETWIGPVFKSLGSRPAKNPLK